MPPDDATEAATADSVEAAIRHLRIPAAVDGALRALAVIADAGGRPVKAREIAQREQMPQRFLSTILLTLREAGLLDSRRGAAGGYWLALRPEEITLAQVFDVVDPRAPHAAPTSATTAGLWQRVESSTRAQLGNLSVAELTTQRR